MTDSSAQGTEHDDTDGVPTNPDAPVPGEADAARIAELRELVA